MQRLREWGGAPPHKQSPTNITYLKAVSFEMNGGGVANGGRVWATPQHVILGPSVLHQHNLFKSSQF